MINKIIVFGSNGMLGNYIKSYFSKVNKYELVLLTRNDFDITIDNIRNLQIFLNNFFINDRTCVINCAGLIPQRGNVNEHEYYIINTIFPLQLSKICKLYGTKLICPTTDCVYRGDKGNYSELDFHNEITSYGISKSLGEPSDCTVIRVSIIGEEKRNKYSFLEFVKNSDKTVNGWDNHLWNGITCLQYCKVIEQIINNNLFWIGVRHLYSPTIKSKYELACIIKKVYNLNININKIHSDNSINKTLCSIYDTNNIFKIPELEIQIYEQSEFNL